MSLCRVLRLSPSEFFALSKRDQRDFLLDEQERELQREFDAFDVVEGAVSRAKRINDTGKEYVSPEAVTIELLTALLQNR